MYNQQHKKKKVNHYNEDKKQYFHYIDHYVEVPIDVVYVIIDPVITSIKEGTFKERTALESVSIPNSVKSIEYSSFYKCRSLATISIPNSVTRIKNAFTMCTSLTSVDIPNSVTEMKRAFDGCTSLTTIFIPNSVTNIAWAFYKCTSLTSVDIPNSVTEMRHAFDGCTSLTTMSIPNSVTDIACAFYKCISLTSVAIPNSVTQMRHAFDGCISLITISLPNSVKNISWAFYKCTSLTSINIPNSVMEMRCAFHSCTLLTSISIPSSVRDITDAFIGCTILNQRRQNGNNHHKKTNKWLEHRFDNLPIHQVCYDIHITPDTLSTILMSVVKGNKAISSSIVVDDTVSSMDAIDMTPLHILCCNPNVTVEMIRILKAAHPEAVDMRDVKGRTPLILYLECKGKKMRNEEHLKQQQQHQQQQQQLERRYEQTQSYKINNLLELGLSCHEMDCTFSLMYKNVYLLELENRNEEGLLPFMIAASSSLPHCGLDMVYMLAMKRIDLLYDY